MSIVLEDLFLDFLDTRQEDFKNDRPVYRTLSACRFASKQYQEIFVVPADFYTDLASVPRLPLVWYIAGGRAPRPAVFHDFGYQTGYLLRLSGGRLNLTKKELDDLFYLMMVIDPISGTNEFQRLAMWSAVRVGGTRTWNRYRSRSKELNPIWSVQGWPLSRSEYGEFNPLPCRDSDVQAP